MAAEISTPSLRNTLVFDIETVPDVAGGRRIHGLRDGDDQGVAELLQHQRRIETQGATEFMRPHLHRVIAISALWWHGEQIKLSSFGAVEDDEPRLVAAKDRLEDFVPQIRPYLQSGAVGFTAAGLVAVRDLNAVPLAQRAQVSALVATNNSLLQNLYQAIANANGHPEWEAQIQATFAQAWINKAPPGRWFQNSAGQWQQK